MNLDFVYNDLKTDRKVFSQMYDFVLNQDIIVPDSKPDILEVLHRSSDICIERSEVLEGKLKINGIVHVDVMYMADNENNDIRGLSTEIELNQAIDIPDEFRQDVISYVDGKVEGIECKITNERKISLIAKVNCDTQLYSNENINYIENIRGDNEDIQVLSRKVQVSKLLGLEMQNISINEEVSINDSEIVEVLESTIKIINEEYKLSYNKVLVKADAVIDIIYVTQNNNISTQQVILPFTGFIDMANVNDNNILDVKYNIKNRSVKLNDNKEDRKIVINMEIGTTIKCFENAEVTMIQDMYSLTRGIGFDTYNIHNDVILCLDNVIYEIKETLDLEELDCQVIGINSRITRNEIKQVNDKLHIEGDITLELMCKDANRLFVKTYQVPYTYIYDNIKIKNSNLHCIDTTIKNITYTVLNNKVDICVSLKLKIDIKNKMDYNLVTNIKEQPQRENFPCSITIYYVKPHDSLWLIAKKFGTTIEEIAKYNDIDSPETYVLQIGTQLFIPQKITKSVV